MAQCQKKVDHCAYWSVVRMLCYCQSDVVQVCIPLSAIYFESVLWTFTWANLPIYWLSEFLWCISECCCWYAKHLVWFLVLGTALILTSMLMNRVCGPDVYYV